MRWFTRNRVPATPIELARPRLDGTGWPGDHPAAAHGFGAATVHRLGLDAAFSPRAREIGDLVTARLVPLLQFESSFADLPHAIDVLRSAARTGAGIGLVGGEGEHIATDAAGALAQAQADLPPMPTEVGRAARYVLWAGHHVARCGDEVVATLAADLDPIEP